MNRLENNYIHNKCLYSLKQIFMSENPSSRKNFIQLLSQKAGKTILSPNPLSQFFDEEEILKLNPEQMEFMLQYGQWMETYIEVIKIQNQDMSDLNNHKKMMQLTEQAEAWQPQLTEFMKDRTFALIYHASIDKMKNEIL